MSDKPIVSACIVNLFFGSKFNLLGLIAAYVDSMKYETTTTWYSVDICYYRCNAYFIALLRLHTHFPCLEMI